LTGSHSRSVATTTDLLTISAVRPSSATTESSFHRRGGNLLVSCPVGVSPPATGTSPSARSSVLTPPLSPGRITVRTRPSSAQGDRPGQPLGTVAPLRHGRALWLPARDTAPYDVVDQRGVPYALADGFDQLREHRGSNDQRESTSGRDRDRQTPGG